MRWCVRAHPLSSLALTEPVLCGSNELMCVEHPDDSVWDSDGLWGNTATVEVREGFSELLRPYHHG